MERQSKETINHGRRPIDVYLIYLNKMYPVLSNLVDSSRYVSQSIRAGKKNPEMMLLVANVTESIK